jgi:hypothetical protein
MLSFVSLKLGRKLTEKSRIGAKNVGLDLRDIFWRMKNEWNLPRIMFSGGEW